jgi:hypothetical protein
LPTTVKPDCQARLCRLRQGAVRPRA